MSFEISKPNVEEVRQATETPFNDLYSSFIAEFDRVSPVTNGSARIGEGQSAGLLHRNPNNLSHLKGLDDDLRVSRRIEISREVPVSDRGEYHASYLILDASGVRSPEDDGSSEGGVLWVPGVSMRYDALISRPLQLLRDFGLEMKVRIKPFDDFGNNKKTVFQIRPITQKDEGSYEASMVKPALRVATQALAGMPDSARE
ncbi:MAG: hypothetical protein AAB436_01600 [Patescibacteria group bacterium]